MTYEALVRPLIQCSLLSIFFIEKEIKLVNKLDCFLTNSCWLLPYYLLGA